MFPQSPPSFGKKNAPAAIVSDYRGRAISPLILQSWRAPFGNRSHKDKPPIKRGKNKFASGTLIL